MTARSRVPSSPVRWATSSSCPRLVDCTIDTKGARRDRRSVRDIGFSPPTGGIKRYVNPSSRVTFEEAATVFVNPLAKIFDDADHSVSETRFAAPRDPRALRASPLHAIVSACGGE